LSENEAHSAYDLLLSSSNGDMEAFSSLFSRYSSQLYNFAYYLTYSREDSEDITSETFVSVYDAIQGRDVAGFNLQAYLYKTAKSAALKSIKRREREGLTMEETLEFSDPGVFADPERATLLSEQRQKVREASEELTLDQQSALLLKELEGLPYDTIATVLDSNPNAVGAMLSRARLKFREVFRMAQVSTEGLSPECLSITPLLSKYIDNEATPEEQELIRAHLESCPVCYENLTSMQEASSTYRSLIPLMPLATLKVWTLAKGAIAGKAVIGGASAAGAHAGAAGSGTAAAGTAGSATGGAGAGTAGTAAASTAAAGTAAAGAAAGAAATAGAAAGLSVLTKVAIVIGAILVLGGAGTGGYYVIKTIISSEGYSIVSPVKKQRVEMEEGNDGSVTVPIKVQSSSGKFDIDVLVDGVRVGNTDAKGTYNWSTLSTGSHTVEIQKNGESTPQQGSQVSFVLAIKRLRYPLVFSRDGDIWSLKLDRDFNVVQGSEKNITNSQEVEGCPVISPDGSKVAYLAGAESGKWPVVGPAASFERVCVMNSDGSAQRTIVDKKVNQTGLTDNPSYTVTYYSLSWAGDGGSLICNGQEGPSYAENVISRIDVVTGSKKIVEDTTTGELAVAKDGNEVETIPLHAPSGDDPTLGITVNGVSRTLFTISQGQFACPSWSQDSSFFSVTNSPSSYTSSSEIWFVDKNGNITKRIPTQMGGYLCPDEKHFYGEQDGEIYVWSIDETTPREITEGSSPSVTMVQETER
jgi:RNA polymerase sigma factor (sigma-70 family)